MVLTPLMERYVLHWGEMGSRWGVNRSVAQIHALLFLAPRPLTAEEIADTLRIARSNVSVSLKELQNFGLIQVAHVMGDRRDHFVAVKDSWELLSAVVEERKRREIDPTLAMLRECAAEAERDRATEPAVKARIEQMLGFVEALNRWYEDVRRLPRPVLAALVRMGARVARLVSR